MFDSTSLSASRKVLKYHGYDTSFFILLTFLLTLIVLLDQYLETNFFVQLSFSVVKEMSKGPGQFVFVIYLYVAVSCFINQNSMLLVKNKMLCKCKTQNYQNKT